MFSTAAHFKCIDRKSIYIKKDCPHLKESSLQIRCILKAEIEDGVKYLFNSTVSLMRIYFFLLGLILTSRAVKTNETHYWPNDGWVIIQYHLLLCHCIFVSHNV